MTHKKNDVHPFEGGRNEATLEFLAQKSDTAFVLHASHNKKRPHTLTLCRMFDGRIMDMVELGITSHASIASIGGGTCAVGVKPAFVFSGELFEQREEYKKIQNMLLDMFRGRIVDKINAGGIESVISVTATEAGLLFRVYRVVMKKSGASTPLIELQLMGPSFDFKVGRTRFAPTELLRQALKKPRELGVKKHKNISTNPLGDKLGRVHVGQQNIDRIQTRKVKALKKSRSEPPALGQDQE